MREPPPGVDPDRIAAILLSGWGFTAERVEHLPVGFGAHHWRAEASDHAWFVTLDALGEHHDAASLEAAYGAAAALDLPVVVGCVPSRDGAYTVAVDDRSRLSCTPWYEGTVVGDGPIADVGTAAENAALLERLHATAPPDRIPRWSPRVGPDLPDRLSLLTSRAWSAGPSGERARTMIIDHRSAIAGWTEQLHRRAVQARERPWVPTHGEPHTRNQLRTRQGIRLVDWESLMLAPPERDLGPLVDFGWPVSADPTMITMFDLDWRLDEVSQYADWFAGPHGAGPDDRIAFDGLVHELTRPG